MTNDVCVVKDKAGRYHWTLLELAFVNQSGQGSVMTDCCAGHQGCAGFATRKDAAMAGREKETLLIRRGY